MSIISDRLMELRKEHKISRNDLISILGIKYSTYANYEQGLREPNSDFLIKIAKIYDVSIDYILGLTKIKSYSINNLDILEDDLNLIKKYRKLDNISKIIVNNIIDLELTRNPNNISY